MTEEEEKMEWVVFGVIALFILPTVFLVMNHFFPHPSPPPTFMVNVLIIGSIFLFYYVLIHEIIYPIIKSIFNITWDF